MSITRPTFKTGDRVLHTTDPDGDRGIVQADTHEGSVWVSVLWDSLTRAHSYPSDLIRPVLNDGRMRIDCEDGSTKTCTFPGRREDDYYCPIHGNH